MSPRSASSVPPDLRADEDVLRRALCDGCAMRYARAAATVLGVAACAGVDRWTRGTRATRAEKQRPLPGDGLVVDPMWQATRATTICAPRDTVWPWLVQMGYPTHRAGWYIPYWMDRLLFGIRARSANEIVREPFFRLTSRRTSKASTPGTTSARRAAAARKPASSADRASGRARTRPSGGCDRGSGRAWAHASRRDPGARAVPYDPAGTAARRRDRGRLTGGGCSSANDRSMPSARTPTSGAPTRSALSPKTI